MDIELKSGSMLGRYELLVRLGRGGMASVWIAREHSPSADMQRLVAVKAMLPELAQHHDFRMMFLEEGQIVQSIAHPNVVKVHEVAEDHGILYMAMDWVEGDSLRALIKEARRRRAIPAEMAVKIIADTAAGLHAAHELRGVDGRLVNLVHCDVSPHNILLGLDGHAQLADFGVANATAHSDVAHANKIKGKFAYMSPEQARAQKLDRRSDVFALGIVLFELTTGERLFRGENAAHTLELVTAGRIPDPAEILPDYPPRLALIVQKALERDVSLRYQTAAEFREALERYLIDERIMVANSSVGKLVRRVLGSRLESQREALREALTAADGILQAGLIPEHPCADRSRPSFSSVPNSVIPAHLSEPPSSISRTSTPHPQTIEETQWVERRSSRGPALFAFLGLVAAAGAVLWVQHARSGPTPLIIASAAAQQALPAAQAATAQNTRSDGSEQGTSINIDQLPVVGRGAAQAHAPTGTWPPLKPKAHPEDTAKHPVAEPPAEPANVEVAPPPEPEKPAPPPKEVPAAGDRPPLSQGAAIAALGAKASTVAGCKRPDAPTGPGRVSVTFSPDGSVSKVIVSAPFAGTPTGACISAVYQSARVPPFSGSSVTLPNSFRIPD